MCNCGKKRTELKQRPVDFNKMSAGVMPSTLQNHVTVLFQYTGNTALTVTGKITRKTYRFNFSGDKQSIDYNDAVAMMAIPVLKKIN